MRVLLYGKFGKYPKEIEEIVKSSGLEIVQKDPEVIICYGGDGTVLGAERDYPGIPKLPLRSSQNCSVYSSLPREELLKMLAENKLHTVEYLKIKATACDYSITALNDIVIGHKFPNAAIRFIVHPEKEELVGDGVVVATPFGSTGYFYSITRKSFKKGIGVAFNNPHKQAVPEQILDEEASIKIVLTRGPAVLTGDNNPNMFDLAENQEIVISKAPDKAKILVP